jgi:hypothetical protein
VIERAICRGSGTYMPNDESDLSLEGVWRGRCPDCGSTFELGYAGFLPLHDAAPVDGSPPDGGA